MDGETHNHDISGDVDAGVDPIIAEEAEQFLREALEASNRFGSPAETPREPGGLQSTPQMMEPSPVHLEAKQELAARLRKRIEEKEAAQDAGVFKVPRPATPRGFGHLSCEDHKKRHERCPVGCPNRLKEATGGTSLEAPEARPTQEFDVSAVTKLGGKGDVEEGAPTREMEVIGMGEARPAELTEAERKQEEDNVEGFLIFCDDAPKEGKIGEDSGTAVTKTPLTKRRKSPKTGSKHKLGGKGSPSNPIFGPQVVKKAMVSLGGKATAVGIAEWISTNRPQYLNYFGSQKKLRYSVSGILSARTYQGIFQKRLVLQKGMRKAEWVLLEGADLLPEESPWDPSMLPAKHEEQQRLSEESLSGLLSLSEAVGEVRQQDSLETCQICNLGTNDDQLLLCDNCDLGYHMYCLDPPLSIVPTGAWYCEYCIPFVDPQRVASGGFLDFNDPELREEIEMHAAEDLAEGEMVSPRACEKHRRWKKRCPDNCPMRTKMKKNSEFGLPSMEVKKTKEPKPKIPKAPKAPKAKRKAKEDDKDKLVKVAKKPKIFREPMNENVPTYIEMIEEAIVSLGGKGTTPDITTFMETHHGELLATKTKTWRNSVSGCLSTHFVRAGKDKMGRTVWNTPKMEELRERLEKEKLAAILAGPVLHKPQTARPSKEPKFKAPSRFSQRVFDPLHLEMLKKNTENLDNKEIKGIEYINRSNPLEVLPNKLSHPGAVMKMCWSTDGTMLATASTLGTVRVWDTTDWSQLQEIRDKEETNLEEFYCVLFSRDDKKIIAGGKIKDRNEWNETDNEALPGVIKVFDILSGKLVTRLQAHTQDVLFIKLIIFNGENYLISCGQDGKIIKWKMNANFSACVSHAVIADQLTNVTAHLDFVPDTGNKFFIACCDTGLKLFDFETEQVLQSFPGMFGYLCDCIEFVKCKEIHTLPNEHHLLVRGVEMLNENDEVVQPNVCQLRKLVLPVNGQGKFRLEEVNFYGHADYHSNIWQLKLATNGRYVLSPTTEGKVFVWNLRSAELVAILNDHANREVRDILFHPVRKLLLSCANDSVVRIYEQTTTAEPPQPPPQPVVQEEDVIVDIFGFTDEEDQDTEADELDDEPKKRKKEQASGEKKERKKPAGGAPRPNSGNQKSPNEKRIRRT